VYDTPVTLGRQTTATLTFPVLTRDQRYFFAVTAFDLAGNESVKSAEVSKLIAAVVPPPVPPLTVTLASPGGLVFTAPQNGTEIRSMIVVTPSRDIVRLDLSRDGGQVFKTLTAAPWSYNLCLNCFGPNEPLPRTMVLMATVTAADGMTASATLALQVHPYTAPVDPPPAPPTGLTISSATSSTIVILAKKTDCPRVVTSTAGTTTATLKRTVTCVK
jgi:hypothetical protein